jgi:hypothetical protein
VLKGARVPETVAVTGLWSKLHRGDLRYLLKVILVIDTTDCIFLVVPCILILSEFFYLPTDAQDS